MDLTIRHLRALVQVADCGGFSAAAQVLHISQPSLSRTIADAEHDLGAEVFVRTTRRCEMTPAGEVVIAHARKLVEAFDAGVLAMRAVARSGEEVIRIAAVPSVAAWLLPRALVEARRAIPRIAVAINTGDADYVAEQVSSRRVDIGVSVRNVSSSLSPVGVRRLPFRPPLWTRDRRLAG